MKTDDNDWRMLLALRIEEIFRGFRLNTWKQVDLFEQAPADWDAAFRIRESFFHPIPDVGELATDRPAESGIREEINARLGRDLRVVVKVLSNATTQSLAECHDRFERWQKSLDPARTRNFKQDSTVTPRPRWLNESVRVPQVVPNHDQPLVPRIIPEKDSQGWHRYKIILGGTGSQGTRLLIVAPHFSDGAARVAAGRGFWFWDASGNYRFEMPGLCAEHGGRPNRYPFRKADDRAIFTKRSAKVARALLVGGNRGWTRDELAKVADVSSGLTSTVVQLLVEQKFCDRQDDGIRVVNRDRLWRRVADSWEATGVSHRFGATGNTMKAVSQVIALCRGAERECMLSVPEGPDQKHGPFCIHATGNVKTLAKAAGLFPDKDGRIVIRELSDRSAMWGAVENTLPKIGRVLVANELQRNLDLAAAGEISAVPKTDSDPLGPEQKATEGEKKHVLEMLRARVAARRGSGSLANLP